MIHLPRGGKKGKRGFHCWKFWGASIGASPMADSNFRSDRGRDPLAELARLIGQAVPQAERAADDVYDRAEPRDDYSRHDHADERYAQAEEHYASSPASAPSHGYAPDRGAQDYGYENEPAVSRYFAGTAAQFNGFREEETPRYAYDDPPQLPPAHQLASYAPAPEQGYDDGGEPHADGAYAADDYPAEEGYDDEAPRPRRRGLVLVAAIFGLAVLGTAGAFGYRAMFGGSVLPTLPPIIKASNGPNKIAPTAVESEASNAANAGQMGTTTTG